MPNSTCIHCGERVVRYEMALGPTWYHQKAGKSFMDDAYRECKTTVAIPKEEL